MIIGFASGFMLPNAIAGAVSVRPQAAGTASGIMGFMQMGLGAATAQLIGHLLAGAQTALPLAIIVLVLCACGLVAFFTLVRKVGRNKRNALRRPDRNHGIRRNALRCASLIAPYARSSQTTRPRSAP